MSQATPQAHDDKQLLATIGQAATQADLGRHQAAYPAVQPNLNLGCVGVATVVLVGAAVAFAVTGYPAVSFIALAPLVVILFIPVYSHRVATKNKGARLDLFERGLISVYQGQLRVFRYDSTTVLQNIVRHLRNGVHTHTTYAYTLTAASGESFVLKGGYVKPAEWGPAIQQAVTQVQLPRAAAALDAGQRLTFGDIWITRDGVGSGSKSARWPEIEEVRVRDGFVTIKVAGKWLGLSRTAVSAIPNFFVFQILAEQLRQSWSGGRQP